METRRHSLAGSRLTSFLSPQHNSVSAAPPRPPPPPPRRPHKLKKPPVTVHERLVFNLYMLRARAHAKGWRPPGRGWRPGTSDADAAGSALQRGAAPLPASGTPAATPADAILFAPIQALINGFQPPHQLGSGGGEAPGGGPAAAALASPSPPVALSAEADADRVLDLWSRQIELERSGLEDARRRYEASLASAVAGGVGADQGPATSLMTSMYQSAVAAIRAEQCAIAAMEKGGDRRALGTRLLLVDAETLAVIALHSLIKATLVPGPANGGTGGLPAKGSAAEAAARGVPAAAGVGSFGRYTTSKDLAAAATVMAESGGSLSPEEAAAAAAALTDKGWRARTGGRPPPPRSVAALEPRLEARTGLVAMAIGRTVQAQVSLERLRESVRREKARRPGLGQVMSEVEAASAASPGAAFTEDEEATLLRRFREISDAQGWGPPRMDALPSMAAAIQEEGEAGGGGGGGGGGSEVGVRDDMDEDAMVAAVIESTRHLLGGRPKKSPGLPSPASDLGRRLKRLEKELASRDRANGSALPRQDIAARALRDLQSGEAWRPDECVKVGAMLVRALIAGCTIPVNAQDVGAIGDAVAAAGEEVSPLEAVDWPAGRVTLPPPPPASAGQPGSTAAALGDGHPAASPFSNKLTVPAFAHYERRWRGKRVGVVRAHDEIGRRAMGRSGLLASATSPDYKPMLVRPLPWRSASEGGHLVLRSLVVRPPRQPGAAQLLKAALKAADARPPAGLSRVYAALNALGTVGWRVNAPTLAAVEVAWAGGGGVAGLPSRTDVPPAPKPPPFYVRRPPASRPGELKPGLAASRELPLERRFRVAANRHASKVNRERHGLRCDVELKLGVARQFGGEGAFYYPHNLDFRGRAYPMHPHLHHLGSDLCRGLLEFAEARPLGPDGYDWLLVQVANAWGQGVDKLSFEGRRAFAEEHLADIHASAADPAVCAWWAGGEDPWQLLQTCAEIRAADATGDPASYPSRVPVRIDGSCNGLQHYAALGRDADGGSAVNLVPGGAPRDVYQGVADVVSRRVSRDAARGVPAAVLLRGEVDRKLVKQTVMTSVYGVTFVGARGQVMDRLRERGWVGAHGGQNSRAVFDAANYAARVTFDGLRELFGGARAIQTWLAEVAGKVASTGAPVAWTTPLGLPVVQPYRRARDHHVTTVLQRLTLQSPDPASPVAVNRQRAAFPPNFIHALDSTHMMMTATAAADAGLVFAGVHDSFWTHAGNVGALSAILRDQFVDLHSRPLLADLAAELCAAHPGLDLPPLPPTGGLTLEQVRESPYFFS